MNSPATAPVRSAKTTVMSDDDRGRYALALSDGEVQRYRFMAQLAREREAQWWQLAGITDGASVLDLGCGPGLVAIEMSQVVGADQ